MRRLLQPQLSRRRFVAFGIAAPRSGSHSLYGMLAGACRAAHRRTPALLVRWTLDVARGAMSREELRRGLRRRDRDLWLELETSNLLEPFFSDLVGLFPRARFILPIRDPLDWLRSYVDFQLHSKGGAPIQALRPHRFGPATAARPAVEVRLAERGLFPIDRYLAWWAGYHRRALADIPPERLLLLRAEELGQQRGDIAAFLGLDPAHLDGTRSHEARALGRSGLVDALPRAYLEERLQHHAGDLLERYFPERSVSGGPAAQHLPRSRASLGHRAAGGRLANERPERRR